MEKRYFLLITFVLFFGYHANSQWICGQDIMDSRDSKVYKTVLIGSQCWMAENLNYGTLIKSTKAGSEMADNGVIEKYCWNDSIENCDGTSGRMKRGGFYEWQEAMQYYTGQPSLPVQGVCLAGWHIPSITEWNTLLNGLGGSSVAYQHMLKGGNSGFEALLTGYRCTYTGGFRTSALDPIAWKGYYWKSEQTDINNAEFLEIASAELVPWSYYKSLGLSIRCIKDDAAAMPEEPLKGFEIKSINHSFDQNLSVEFNASKATQINYSIINFEGKFLYSGNYLTTTGKNYLKVEKVTLPAGMYILRLNNQDFISNKKFLVE